MTRQELADRAGVDRKTLYNLFVQNLSVRDAVHKPFLTRRQQQHGQDRRNQ